MRRTARRDFHRPLLRGGELLREYLSQIVTLVIIAFLLWRVETLQELKDEV